MAKLGKQEVVKRLKEHLANLKAGGSISKRDMQSLLTDEQMQQYEGEWQSAQDYKQSIIDGRNELESYTKKLKVADAIWARYENTKSVNQKAATEYASQSAYEKALEHLEELIDANPAVQMYLDRPVRFDAGHDCGLTAGEVPRYKLSKSHYALDASFPTKSDIKIQIIESAIDSMLAIERGTHHVGDQNDVIRTISSLAKDLVAKHG